MGKKGSKTNVIVPGIKVPNTELISLCLDLYSSWKSENYVLVVKNSSFNHQNYL